MSRIAKLEQMIENKESEIWMNFLSCSEGEIVVCRNMLVKAGYQSDAPTHPQQTFKLREQQ